MSGQNGPPDLSELAGVQKTHASDPTNARPSPHISQVNYSPVWPDGGILLVVEVAGIKTPPPVDSFNIMQVGREKVHPDFAL